MQSKEKQLRQYYEEILAKEKIEIHLKNIDRLILANEEALHQAEQVLQKEKRDIARLEKQSLYTIFQSILGNKEQQLEKERQEYLQAFLKRQATENSLQALRHEKELLLKNYSIKFNAEANFDKLVRQLKDDIRSSNPELANLIIHFEERMASLRSKLKELKQAVRQGKKTIQMLRTMLVALNKVANWGAGNARGLVGKRVRVKDQIKRGIYRTEKYIQHFEKELFDLSDHYGHDYTHQIDEIKGFLDLLLDSLISDWIVKNKIQHAANLTANLEDKVVRIVAMLETDIGKTKTYISAEQKDQRKLIARQI